MTSTSQPIVQLTDTVSRLGGGVMEAVLGLSEALARTTTVRVLSGQDARTETDADCFQLLTPETFGLRRVGPLTWSPGLRAALQEVTNGVVHLHGIWGPASRALAGSGLLKSEVPLLVSPHGMLEPWALRRSAMKKRLAWKVWDGPVVKGAHSLHALCQAELESIRNRGLKQPVAIIPNGVNLPTLCDETPASDVPMILFLGRLHPKKGLTELLRGWKSLLPDTNAILTIAGWDDGGHEGELRKLAGELQLGERVRFVGPKFGDEKVEMFRAADAFILPSHSEGLPMAILEAWSFAKPVLMTDHCHLPQGFEKNAALRTEPEAEAIARSLRSFLALSGDERTAIGERGRKLVRDEFTWDAVAAKFRQLHDWMLRGGERPAFVGM